MLMDKYTTFRCPRCHKDKVKSKMIMSFDLIEYYCTECGLDMTCCTMTNESSEYISWYDDNNVMKRCLMSDLMTDKENEKDG